MKTIQTQVKFLALALLTCMTLLVCVTPALAGPANVRFFRGVDDGDVVNGGITVFVYANGDTSQLFYQLTGPDDYSFTVERSGHWTSWIYDEDGNPIDWDSTSVPDGTYTLSVFSITDGERDRALSVTFQVDNAEETEVASIDSDTLNLLGFDAQFAGTGETYQPGTGDAIAIDVTGELGGNNDLLVLAWSVAEERMVDEFAFTLSEGPWQIPAQRLEMLPEGIVNLQLHLREDARIVHSVRRDVRVLAPVEPTPEPEQPIEDPVIEEPVEEQPEPQAPVTIDPSPEPILVEAFTAGFDNLADSYQLGSGQSIALAVTGTPAENHDLLVLAWSVAEGRMVDEFAFAMDQEPWRIPAHKLEMLPEGIVNLQVHMREDSRIVSSERRDIRVLAAPAPQPEQPIQDPVVEDPVVQEPTPEIPIAQDPIPTTPVADDPIVEDPAPQDPVVEDPAPADPVVEQPTANSDPIARFIDTPTQYVIGSGASINYEVENLPEGGDVLIIAWSDSQAALVDSFAHYTNQGPWRISSAQLDQLPVGSVHLQLIVRGGDVRPKTVHRLDVVNPSTAPAPQDPVSEPTPEPTPGDSPTDPTPEPTTEPEVTTDPQPTPEPEPQPQPNPTPTPDAGNNPLGDLEGGTIGFTPIVRYSNTRVVYVSSSRGNDANDGLSEQTPVRSLARGMALIRNGYPDHLLLRCGDVWDGESFTDFGKSGQSPDRPMVVSTYGEGDRPLIMPAFGEHGFKTTSDRINGLVIQGLHIYAVTRDPASTRYINRDGHENGINSRIGGSLGKFIEGLVIEDCYISHFDDNILLTDDWARQNGEGFPGRMQVVVRRNIIRFAQGDDAHSIGLYIEGSRDSVIEWNLLDHNGWHPDLGVTDKDPRSHNIYAQRFNGPLTIRNNIISRGAAHGLQLRAGGDILNNLFVQNALAFFTAINDSRANYNVILESVDMNTDVPNDWRGMGLNGWQMDRFEVIGNVVSTRLGNRQVPGIDVSAGTLTVQNNVVYNWQDGNDGDISVMASGANLSTNLIPENFGWQDPPYVDPDRNVDSYAGTIGLDASLEAFIEAAANRPRGVWIDELATDSVCRYIRNGFELLPHD